MAHGWTAPSCGGTPRASRCGALCLLLVALLTGPLSATTAAQDGSQLDDGRYTSPSWGFSAAWNGADWTIAEQTSEAGVDALWLRNDFGDEAGFIAGAFYDGDAMTCLDDQIAVATDAPGTSDVVVTLDEHGAEQTFRRPLRAWTLLLASVDGDDRFVYLDCRALVPGEALLIRTLAGPASTFETAFATFDVLNVTLPRSAWQTNEFGGLSAPELDPDGVISPLPADVLTPWEFPRNPWLLVGRDGVELGMMTLAGGTADGQLRIIVENSGQTPLTIDPARFTAANDPARPAADQPIAPTRVGWEMPGVVGPRVLAPGAQATLLLDFPKLEDAVTTYTYLTYNDDALRGGVAKLDCLDRCGYGGGGTRAPVLIGR